MKRFLTLLVLPMFAFSIDVDKKLLGSSYLNLPAEARFKLKNLEDLTVLANDYTFYVTKLEVDEDKDGVPDYKDWCKNTPAGAKVWTEERVKTEKQKPNVIGCAFIKGDTTEVWSETQAPKGKSMQCMLYSRPSSKTRILEKNKEFTIQEKYTKTYAALYELLRIAEKPYSPETKTSGLLVRTAGGFEAFLSCFSALYASKINGDSLEISYEGSTFNVPFYVSDFMETFELVNIPKPTVIGMK